MGLDEAMDMLTCVVFLASTRGYHILMADTVCTYAEFHTSSYGEVDLEFD